MVVAWLNYFFETQKGNVIVMHLLLSFDVVEQQCSTLNKYLTIIAKNVTSLFTYLLLLIVKLKQINFFKNFTAI